MNREIIFRGFYLSELGATTIYINDVAAKGDWVYGYLAFIYVNGFVHTDLKAFLPFAQIYFQDECKSYDVLTCTVCQYTGLVDKHACKIFEGDIVIVNDYIAGSPYNDFCGDVVFADCSYSIKPKDPQDSLPLYNECAVYEVISTIFYKP